MHPHHLPPELLAHVLQLTVDAHCGVPCTWDTAQSPLLLAAVCTLWHTLVVHTPALWSHIHVEPTPTGLRRAHLWLQRSQNVPLHISICARHMHADSPTDLLNSHSVYVPALVDIFLPHLSRIRTFQSHLGGYVVPALFPIGATVRLPILEQLGLRIDDAPSHSLVTAFLESSLGLIDAPRLSNLVVSDITPIAETVAPILSQIRTLNVLDAKFWVHSRIFPTLLAQCKKIQHCSIMFPNNCYFMTPVDPINLPDLKTLEMEWSFLFDPVSVFGALTAPCLESLKLSHLSRQLILPPSTFGALRTLVQSAASTLRSITLVGCNLLTQDDSTALFEDCVSLERLTLTHCMHVDKLLSPLTPDINSHLTISTPPEAAAEGSGSGSLSPPPPGSTWLCPRLLDVTIDGIQDAGVRPIVAFARSRCLRPASTSPRVPSPMLSSVLERSPPPAEGKDEQSVDPTSSYVKQQHLSVPRLDTESTSDMRRASASPTSPAHSYLQQLTLCVDITALSRNARILLLSGLYPIHHDMHIMGSCGELFARADAGFRD